MLKRTARAFWPDAVVWTILAMALAISLLLLADARAQQYLADNPDLPSPQLFDEANPGCHAPCRAYGMNGTPTMFLIDKKGVLRSVAARAHFEKHLPNLLDE